MQIKLSDRAKEINDRYNELVQEKNDYNNIVMCIKALQAADMNRNKWNYTQEDYDGVVNRLRSLCAKHEVVLPDTDYIEWGNIEIV